MSEIFIAGIRTEENGSWIDIATSSSAEYIRITRYKETNEGVVIFVKVSLFGFLPQKKTVYIPKKEIGRVFIRQGKKIYEVKKSGEEKNDPTD